MTSPNDGPTSRCHLVAMPYPGRGHINPMINLCKSIASKSNNNILITIVVTEEWLGLIGSDSKPVNIRFETIPNVVPSELVRAADMLGFVEALTNMEEPFERVLERLEPPASVIVADTHLSWAVEVGNRRKVAVASLWPMSVSMYAVFHYFELVLQHHHFPIHDLSERGDELVEYIPGLSATRIADFPTIFGRGEFMLQKTLHYISNLSKAQYILFSSIQELEPRVIEHLKPQLSLPLYTVGPLIPHLELENDSSQNQGQSEPNYLKWLDSQATSSVLYVSFGSNFSVLSAQLDEIIAGVGQSGVPYLWVARGDVAQVREASGGIGLVLAWCEQLRVLCHSSIGGFWSHCGWNSTQEAVYAGVPVLSFPLVWDQTLNSKMIVDDWKVGWRVKKEDGSQKLVRREEISSLVQRFMDLESVEGKEMRRRARELRRLFRAAVESNGSSETNINAFVKDILEDHIRC